MIIDGKKMANEVLEELQKETNTLKEKNIYPKLAAIMVGANPSSKVYLSNKKKACEKVGIISEEYLLPENTPENEIKKLIEKLNARKDVSGILVQLPLPNHVNPKFIYEKISPFKDVDALGFLNAGKLIQGTAWLIPCTPAGIIEMLKRKDIPIEGKRCIVIGRSDIVGKPMSVLLLQHNATVTIAHSFTVNLEKICKEADIIISAVGKPKFITSKMIKKGATFIDVGINRDKNGKLCGDADFENLEPLCSYITPVPGGVGPMTVAMLMKNTIIASKIQNEKIKEK